MLFETWLQNPDGREITVVAEMRRTQALALERELRSEKLAGSLADYYVTEHSQTAGGAIDQLRTFINRSRRDCYRE
jgi:hypothetical protein